MTVPDIPTPDEVRRRIKARNRAMLIILAGLAILFYGVTIVRLGGQ